jgi:hypothetical protein
MCSSMSKPIYNLTRPLDRAVKLLGGPTKAAVVANVSWFTLRRWMRAGGVVPKVEAAQRLSQAVAALGANEPVGGLMGVNQTSSEPS